MNIEDIKDKLKCIDDNLNILSELISDTPIQRYFLYDDYRFLKAINNIIIEYVNAKYKEDLE